MSKAKLKSCVFSIWLKLYCALSPGKGRNTGDLLDLTLLLLFIHMILSCLRLWIWEKLCNYLQHLNMFLRSKQHTTWKAISLHLLLENWALAASRTHRCIGIWKGKRHALLHHEEYLCDPKLTDAVKRLLSKNAYALLCCVFFIMNKILQCHFVASALSSVKCYMHHWVQAFSFLCTSLVNFWNSKSCLWRQFLYLDYFSWSGMQESCKIICNQFQKNVVCLLCIRGKKPGLCLKLVGFL